MYHHKTWMNRLFRLSIVATMTATLMACARDEGASSQASPPRSVGGSADGGASVRLVVYTYDSFPKGLEDLLVSHFDETHGVTVSVERFQDAGGLYNEVFLTKGEMGADLVIGLDNTYIGKALSEELFQPYRPDEIEAIDPELIVDDSFRLIPFDYGNIVLNYDSEAISDPPSTWEELTDPRFRESIVLMNPATSSPGRNFLLLTVEQFGEDGYIEYWHRLAPNILTITAGWSEGYGLYTQGEAPIVLSYETSPAYHIVFDHTHRYKNLILDGVGYAQIEVMGIVQGAVNVTNAKRGIDFILSEGFQREIAMNQFMYPVREEIELPEAFTAVERPDRSIFIATDRVDRHFDTWLATWEVEMR